MKIRIFDVGPHKKETLFEIPDSTHADDVAATILKQVKALKALGSKGVECTWNTDSRQGVVTVGGFRIVGYSEVLP